MSAVQKGPRPKTLKIERKALQEGDQVIVIDPDRSILFRRDGLWDCRCTKKHWDCDIGPNDEIWCTEQCIEMTCDWIAAPKVSGISPG